MAYQLNKWNGDKLLVLDDGTLDNTTSLGLVGKNFAGYGQTQNENFVYLLENFAGTQSPGKSLVGQLWYDSNSKRIRVFEGGTTWRIVGNTDVQNTSPVEPAKGDGWLDTTDNKFYVYDGTAFKFVGPEAVAGYSVTRQVSTKVRDQASPTTYHPIIKTTLNGTVVSIFAERDFEIYSADRDPGFDQLSKGITVSSSSRVRGNLIGNADTATKLASSKNINGVAFDGSLDINILAVSPHAIHTSQYLVGAAYDGTSEVTWSINADSNNTSSSIVARDSVGNFRASDIYATNFRGAVIGNVTGNVTGDVTGRISGTIHTATDYFSGNLRGNVTGNVIGNVNGTIGATTPSSGSFTTVTVTDQFVANGTPGIAGLILKSRGPNLSPEWSTPIVDLTNQVANILATEHGGTGRGSFPSGYVVVGAGAGTLDVVAPGTKGNVLTSDGGRWTSVPNGILAQVVYFATPTAPEGWLICDGAAISRATYSALFSAIGTLYGTGDGVNTFNLPDLRGEFIRGWDGGRGVDVGRTFASRQASAVAPHTHDFTDVYGSNDDGSGPNFLDRNGNPIVYVLDDTYYAPDEDGDHTAVTFDNRTAANDGTETRPRNVALLPCIKY